jgi:hypothetical protein
MYPMSQRSSSHRASLPPAGPNSKSGVSALLRRFSTPSNYTGGVVSVGQPAVDPMSLIDNQIHDPLSCPASPPTVHQYILKSRGKDYAFIIVKSHALNGQDPPLLYFGEDITGYVILSLSDLSDMQRMDVAVSQFLFLIGMTAIELGNCSCRCSIRTPLSHGLKSSVPCHRRRSMNLTSQAENFAGPLLLLPQPIRSHRQAHRLIQPQDFNRPMAIVALVVT